MVEPTETETRETLDALRGGGRGDPGRGGRGPGDRPAGALHDTGAQARRGGRGEAPGDPRDARLDRCRRAERRRPHCRRAAAPERLGCAPMEHRKLGATGISVSPLCLGAMMFGAWGNTDHDDSIRIIHAALDAGINFIDTADVYSRGESEEIVGKALAADRRDSVVLATKVHGRMGDPIRTRSATRGAGSSKSVEDSLDRLETDCIDLYQIHRPGAGHRHRRDARRAERPGRAPARCARSASLDVPRLRRSWRRSGRPSAAGASASSASSRPTRC